MASFILGKRILIRSLNYKRRRGEMLCLDEVDNTEKMLAPFHEDYVYSKSEGTRNKGLLGERQFKEMLLLAKKALNFWNSLQVLLTFMAILSPLLACVTLFAVLGWLGVTHNSVMSLIPPLVLGIGKGFKCVYFVAFL